MLAGGDVVKDAVEGENVWGRRGCEGRENKWEGMCKSNRQARVYCVCLLCMLCLSLVFVQVGESLFHSQVFHHVSGEKPFNDGPEFDPLPTLWLLQITAVEE